LSFDNQEREETFVDPINIGLMQKEAFSPHLANRRRRRRRRRI